MATCEIDIKLLIEIVDVERILSQKIINATNLGRTKDRMKLYKVFPIGFDPMVAAGPPSDYMILLSETWTPEETQQALSLEAQFEIIEAEYHTTLPKNRWHIEIGDK